MPIFALALLNKNKIMAKISKVTVSINAPVEKVWKIFMDPDSLKHWLTGFVSVEHLTGNPGEKVSTSKLKFIEHGKEIEVIETVLMIEPEKLYMFSIYNDKFMVENEVLLTSYGERTELTQSTKLFPKVFFLKLMAPIITPSMKRKTLNDLMKLKKFIESN